MVKSTSSQFDDVLTRALRLSPTERLAMLEELAMSLESVLPSPVAAPGEEEDFDPEEIAELMRIEPLSPEEIAAQGLLGTWADLNIADGAEWVNEQKKHHTP
jgi:hypothetical protein